MAEEKLFKGGCHCGAVRYELLWDGKSELQDCNCSICSKKGFIHIIRPNLAFKLLSGKDNLTLYQFNSKVAKHYFCKTCGICTHYIPRSNPDGVDINARTFDDYETIKASLNVQPFDGRNWEANAAALSHLSKDPDTSDQ
mmetsp:Transcript_19898/g.22144  ORF Transcript_19898/g.22144 Transcript_19898/m.22144 type:complete len:140 (+) Transcript_19898:78-497(+)